MCARPRVYIIRTYELYRTSARGGFYLLFNYDESTSNTIPWRVAEGRERRPRGLYPVPSSYTHVSVSRQTLGLMTRERRARDWPRDD